MRRNSTASFYGLIAIFLSSLMGCSGDKNPVIIEPGKFVKEWPTAIRSELINSKRCAIDSINGRRAEQVIAITRGESLTLSGWVFSKADGALPEVYVQLIGPAMTYTALAQSRTARSDVNHYFKLDPTSNAGFELHAAQEAEAGEYHLEILQPGPSGVAQCETKLIVKIE